jgi:hypothetical protein
MASKNISGGSNLLQVVSKPPILSVQPFSYQIGYFLSKFVTAEINSVPLNV